MTVLEKWHEVVKTKDYELLSSILADDVVFYSPVVFTPQKGKQITLMYVSAAAEVFEGNSFRYTNEIINGNKASIEFELELEGIKVNGVDLITWNENQKITEFKVFIRPLQAVNAMHKQMGVMLEKMS